ncbi:hypothetical protein FG05_01707 [Fusarium graminearum]|nr:hypothetical protein FG05_01707 [Fusarium graminearum]
MMADQMVNELRLEYLPPEILSEIGRCMPLEDLKKMSMTSKKMRRSFSRWLFHSVAVIGDADEVVYQIEYMLPSVNTEMRQMMVANVNSLCTVDSTASDSTQKIMNRLVNKFARNSIKSLTLKDDRGNNLLEIAKTECPDLRRLILRKNYPKIHQPPPSEILEAVGKDISKAFPELEWFVIDYKWEPRSEEDAAVGLKMASQALAPGEDHEEEDYFHRDFESGIAHIAQIAPKLKEICFTTFNMWAYDTCVDGTRYEYSLIYRGVRNTESAKMSLERPPAPGRHGFPRGLIF